MSHALFSKELIIDILKNIPHDYYRMGLTLGTVVSILSALPQILELLHKP